MPVEEASDTDLLRVALNLEVGLRDHHTVLILQMRRARHQRLLFSRMTLVGGAKARWWAWDVHPICSGQPFHLGRDTEVYEGPEIETHTMYCLLCEE